MWECQGPRGLAGCKSSTSIISTGFCDVAIFYSPKFVRDLREKLCMPEDRKRVPSTVSALESSILHLLKRNT